MPRFSATIYRGPDDDEEFHLTIEATLQPYADAIDCPGEYRSRFAGRYEVAFDSITDDATGKAFEPTDGEHDQLREMALERRHDAADVGCDDRD